MFCVLVSIVFTYVLCNTIFYEWFWSKKRFNSDAGLIPFAATHVTLNLARWFDWLYLTQNWQSLWFINYYVVHGLIGFQLGVFFGLASWDACCILAGGSPTTVFVTPNIPEHFSTPLAIDPNPTLDTSSDTLSANEIKKRSENRWILVGFVAAVLVTPIMNYFLGW